MVERDDESFLREINNNIGIAHSVSRIYFPDDDERKDAFQEMMYQLWKSYPAFDRRSKFSTWMYRVCLNTALTFRKRENRRRAEPIRDGHFQIPERTPDNLEEESQLLSEAISRLSDLNKAIILLYLEDQSYEEIAEVTGLTKSNVSVRLVRIRKELEEMVKTKIKQS